MQQRQTTVATRIFATSGMWLIALGLYFALLRPALLSEDVRYMGASAAHVTAAIPGVAAWLRHVFVVMGGFMIASGVLTLFLAFGAVAERRRGTGIALLVAGLASVATMSWTNFAIDSAFKWLLLGPALLWFTGLVLYAVDGRHNR